MTAIDALIEDMFYELMLEEESKHAESDKTITEESIFDEIKYNPIENALRWKKDMLAMELEALMNSPPRKRSRRFNTTMLDPVFFNFDCLERNMIRYPRMQ